MNLKNVIEVAQQKGILPEDLIDEIWATQTNTIDKINMSLSLFEVQPTYHVLSTMWFNYRLSSTVTDQVTELILNAYLNELSNPMKPLTDSMEYSLYFDIFEDPDRNESACKYFIGRDPNDHFLKMILRNSGPVPYHLKQNLYDRLIANRSYHADIYRSIRHSCFDNCGLVDKQQALKTLNKLDLRSELNQINSEVGFRTFEEVVQYLNKNGS